MSLLGKFRSMCQLSPTFTCSPHSTRCFLQHSVHLDITRSLSKRSWSLSFTCNTRHFQILHQWKCEPDAERNLTNRHPNLYTLYSKPSRLIAPCVRFDCSNIHCHTMIVFDDNFDQRSSTPNSPNIMPLLAHTTPHIVWEPALGI